MLFIQFYSICSVYTFYVTIVASSVLLLYILYVSVLLYCSIATCVACESQIIDKDSETTTTATAQWRRQQQSQTKNYPFVVVQHRLLVLQRPTNLNSDCICYCYCCWCCCRYCYCYCCSCCWPTDWLFGLVRDLIVVVREKVR